VLRYALVLLAVFAQHSAVYVKGHSDAALKARERLQNCTCYNLAERPDASDAVLEVDHILGRSGNRRVVMVLLGRGGHVLWEGKTAEDPWPLPSPVNRLLKRLARSTCSAADLVEARDVRPVRDARPTPVK
jgi:hypothetical protein